MGSNFYSEAPESWLIKKFGEIAKITCGVAATPEYVDESVGIPFFSASNVQKGKLKLDKIKYIPIELHNKLTKNTKPEKGDVLMTRVGAGIGEAAVVDVDYDFSVYVSLTLIKCGKKLDSNFVQAVLNTDYYRYLALREQFAGGGVQNLNVQMVKDYTFPVPPLPEQQKIAKILSTWDKAIATTERLIATSQQQKKALMQQLLTGKKRLINPDSGMVFEGDWEEVKLDELGKTFTGLTGKTKDDFGKGKPYIPYMNIFKNSAVDIDALELVNVNSSERQNTVQYGDFFFTTSSETPEEVGMSSVMLNETKASIYLNSFCFGFRPHNIQRLAPEFAQYLLRSTKVRRSISILAQGATRYNLSKTQLLKIELKFPSLGEQQKIASVLTAADKEIELLEAKLAHLKDEKKALMQQLLTGKRRVKSGAHGGGIMLTQIQIKKFKSYQDQVLHLSPLTLMIGANASGKSNALEAFHFLAWIAQGLKLSTLKYQVDDSEKILRGQVKDLGYLGAQAFSLGCMTDDKVWNHFEVEISLRDDELHISQESISSPKESFPLYKIAQPSSGLGTDVRIAYNNFARGGKKPQIPGSDQMAVLNQLISSAMFESGHKKAQKVIPMVTDQFQKLLSNTLFLDPVPALMRGDSRPERSLRGDCANLSGVLYTLWKEESMRAVIVDFIKSLPEQDVKDISFFEDRRGQVSLELVESFGHEERTWSVELLSDGTLRVLAIAAALLSAPEGSTVVIEEVDNGVHPSRAKQLLSTMREQAEKRNVRLLLSTHNPALMDALPDSALGDVVFCYRNPKSGDSELIRLSDLNDYPGLVAQGPLGELVTNGIVDRFVKSPVTPEDKKKRLCSH